MGFYRMGYCIGEGLTFFIGGNLLLEYTCITRSSYKLGVLRGYEGPICLKIAGISLDL